MSDQIAPNTYNLPLSISHNLKEPLNSTPV